jgi:hypothetical protein
MTANVVEARTPTSASGVLEVSYAIHDDQVILAQHPQPLKDAASPVDDRQMPASDFRRLALLTTFRGAKLGANAHRHRATSGDVQRFSLRPEPTSGDTGRRQATLGNRLLVLQQ